MAICLATLIPDCIREIASRASYVGQLLFASTCKPLLSYKPKDKLATDDLLLRVIAAGSQALYDYYDTKDMKPVWNYLLNMPHVMANLGKNLEYAPLLLFY